MKLVQDNFTAMNRFHFEVEPRISDGSFESSPYEFLPLLDLI